MTRLYLLSRLLFVLIQYAAARSRLDRRGPPSLASGFSDTVTRSPACSHCLLCLVQVAVYLPGGDMYLPGGDMYASATHTLDSEVTMPVK